eukprot:1092-Pyramimonas_sp.AAC.1
MQVRAVMTIHAKKARGRRHFESLDAIKQQFLLDLYNVNSAFKEVEPPWKLDGGANPSARATSSSAAVDYGFRTFDAVGVAQQYL